MVTTRVFAVTIRQFNRLTLLAAVPDVDDGISWLGVRKTPDDLTMRFKSCGARFSKVDAAKFGGLETAHAYDYTDTISGLAT